MKTLLVLSSLFALTFNASYAYPPLSQNRSSDDRLLSRGVQRAPQFSEALAPDAIQNNGSHPGAFIQFVRLVKNQPTPISGLRIKTAVVTRGGSIRALEFITDAYGRIEMPTCEQGGLRLQTQFAESRYSIASGRRVYTLQADVPCKARSIIVFKEDSPVGQVIGIHQVIQRALAALAQVSDFAFWDRPIRFKFPSDGDYYMNDQVNLTLGHQWDVVGHEMGHAIYDQAQVGYFGGGQHKIDECYSATLALSEGWASYFSAWIHTDLKDVDAKFEYMVPRRAPIRFEHVPADVCGKSTNEWRVTSFFWDLIDLNSDGEISQVSAKKLWDDLLSARVSSVKAAADRLISRGWNREQIQQVWRLNFPAEAR